jgi:hypothetical protein
MEMKYVKPAIDIIKAIMEFRDSVKTIYEYKESIDRATKGREPFPPPKDIQRVLDSNARLEQKLKTIARSGIPDPIEPKVNIEALANPSTKPQTLFKLKQVMNIRTNHQKTITQRIADLSEVTKEAETRSQTTRYLSDVFTKLAKAPLPDVGSANRTMYFSYSQLMQKGTGSLNTIARDAKLAKNRIEKDLKFYRTGTDNLQANLKAFGVH